MTVEKSKPRKRFGTKRNDKGAEVTAVNKQESSSKPPRKKALERRDNYQATDLELVNIERMAGLGLTKEKIAHLLGIDRTTFLRRSQKDPRITAAFHKGRADMEMTVAQKAFDMAASGSNGPMTQFWLRCRAGWNEQQGKAEGQVQVNINNQTLSVHSGTVEKLQKELSYDEIMALKDEVMAKRAISGEVVEVVAEGVEETEHGRVG